ncbi:hypothetical protein BD311DRAFT_74685 [Dichomitus squalens]|uniref:Secreted protein n=1 Tax=Dichomitus squalens TaxID=114155 RepID=A0A4V2K182_9APHY|nr:hypothetical protein BD311DRAFT_74685 [Dichomitus squalens]
MHIQYTRFCLASLLPIVLQSCVCHRAVNFGLFSPKGTCVIAEGHERTDGLWRAPSISARVIAGAHEHTSTTGLFLELSCTHDAYPCGRANKWRAGQSTRSLAAIHHPNPGLEHQHQPLIVRDPFCAGTRPTSLGGRAVCDRSTL